MNNFEDFQTVKDLKFDVQKLQDALKQVLNLKKYDTANTITSKEIHAWLYQIGIFRDKKEGPAFDKWQENFSSDPRSISNIDYFFCTTSNIQNGDGLKKLKEEGIRILYIENITYHLITFDELFDEDSNLIKEKIIDFINE